MNFDNFETQGAYRNSNYTNSNVSQFVNAVYGWMFLALLLTAGISYATATNEALLAFAINNMLFIGILQIALVLIIGFAFNKLSSMNATILFFVYAGLNGLLLSPIFIAYTSGSIFTTFIVCAAMFGVTSLIGLVTKKNLDGVGRFAIMALVGIIIASIINFFVKSSSMDMILTYAGVLVFVALTAYDNQKIKRIGATVDPSSPFANKYAIYGALALYLDFINLFLHLLRIMGRRK
ncbi:MAG: Bax inhibitor-1/YccA family protein [Fusobacteria bacterium]|nr:Bax inhibitor-1/YccA family protein [Fusobacteriota bacterium]